MNGKLLVLALAFSITAQAHMEIGTHKGFDQTGQECAMQVSEVRFENNQPHPLNERVVLKIQDQEWTVSHPAEANFAKPAVGFDHDFFRAVRALPTGGEALEIRMLHEEGREGPISYTWIQHNWKTKETRKVVCDGLQFQKESTTFKR